MENLPDEIVLEIIHRLPTKDAIRCHILNKRFHILVQKFEHENIVQSNKKVCNHVYFSPWHPNSFYHLRLDPSCPSKYWETHNNFDGLFPLLNSYGGLLLLNFRGFNRTYCVLNPITGEYQLVPSKQYHDRADLVVDHSYRFRLVAIQFKEGRTEEERLYKFRIFTAGLSTWEDAYEEYLPYAPQSLEYLPVYSHGSLHWLVQFNTILSFDLEKRRPRIFHASTRWPDWFGVVQGSLVCVYACSYEMVIDMYDHVSSKWHIHHRIGNLKPQHKTCDVKFFNGERLVIVDLRHNTKGEIYMYDISSKSWKTIGVMKNFVMGKRFIPFIPTATRLYSGLYANGKESPSHSCITMQALHHLVNIFKIESN